MASPTLSKQSLLNGLNNLYNEYDEEHSDLNNGPMDDWDEGYSACLIRVLNDLENLCQPTS